MRFFRDLIFTGLGLIALLLVLEGGLRLARDRNEASLFETEAQRGYALRPYAQGWNVIDGETWVEINGDGFRDRQRLVSRPAGTLRIALVGASEVEAAEVPLDQTIASRMEHTLDGAASRVGRHVEVLSFGVEGYSYSQNYLTLRDRVWKYDPKVVVLLATAFSVLKSAPELYPGPTKGTPFYQLRDGRLVLDESASPRIAPDPVRLALKNRASDIMNRSYLLSLLNMVKVALPAHIAALRKILHPSATQGAGSELSPLDVRVLQFNPGQPEAQKAWAVSESLLLAMRDECRRHGAEFYVVVVDTPEQTDPDPARRAATAKSRGLPSFDLSDRRFQSFGAANGIGVFPLAPPMAAYAEEHHTALHGRPQNYNSGHWNELGNRLAAQSIIGYLYRQSPEIEQWVSGARLGAIEP